MRLRMFVVFALVCWSCGAPKTSVPEVNFSGFQPAVRAQIESIYRTAREHPDESESVGKLGMTLEAYRQDQTAIACYKRAHELDPQNVRWTYLLGRLTAAVGQTAEAIPILQAAASSYNPANVALGNSLVAENRAEDAIRAFERALAHDPKYAAAHYGLGRAFSLSGNPSKALEHHAAACAVFPDYGATHYAAAQILQKQADSAGAARELQAYEKNKNAVPPEEDPYRQEVAALNNGAMMLLREAAKLEQAGQLEAAAAQEEKALEVDPSLVQAHVNLISLYGKLENYTKAEEHFRKAAELDGKQADAYYNYGVLLFRRKQNQGAERAFQDALERNPFHAAAHHNLGFLYEQQGDLRRALQHYEKATSAQPAYPLAHFHAGRILANQRQYDTAIAHLQKSITPESNETPSYLYALAATYARKGDRAEAVRYASRARHAAMERGQTELVASIDKDFRR